MPQLDASTYLPQIIWLIISFAALYYLLKTKALPRVGEILEARQDRIAADLDQAASHRREAEEAMRRLEEMLAQARGEAQATLAENQRTLQGEAQARHEELEAKLSADLAAAEQRIAEARSRSLKQIRSVAAEVAQAATHKLIGVKVTKKAAEAALREDAA